MSENLMYLVRNKLDIALTLYDLDGDSVQIPAEGELVVESRFIDFLPPEPSEAEWEVYDGISPEYPQPSTFSPFDGMFLRIDKPQVINDVKRIRALNNLGIGPASSAGFNTSKLILGNLNTGITLKPGGDQELFVRNAIDDTWKGVRALQYAFSQGTVLKEASDGSIALTNSTGNANVSLRFGGTTDTFPMLRGANSTTVELKQGDNSAYADISVRKLTVKGAANAVVFDPRGGSGASFNIYNEDGGSLRINNGTNDVLSISATGVFTYTSALFIGQNPIQATNGETFTFDGDSLPRHGLRWFSDSTANAGSPGMVAGLSAYYGLRFFTKDLPRWTVTDDGHLLAHADNAYDIGTSGANRPRNVYTAGNVNIGNSAAFLWDTRTRMYSSQNGVIALATASGDNFHRLQFGGITNAFPALKRDGTTLAVRLADDSGDASLKANGLHLSGLITVTSSASNAIALTRTGAGANLTLSFTMNDITSYFGNTQPGVFKVGTSVDLNSSGHVVFHGGAHTLFTSDKTYDIGNSVANRPRDVHVARKLVIANDVNGDGPAVVVSTTTKTPDEFAFVAQRNGVSAGGIANDGSFRQFNTTDISTNFERGWMQWNSNEFTIMTDKGGTGSARSLSFGTNGTRRWYIDSAGTLMPHANNTHNIGSSGNRVQNIWVNNTVTTANVTLSSTGLFSFSTRSNIRSPADGDITITNNAETGFNRLQLGGTTSAFPALKRNGVIVQIRLADDSNWARIQTEGVLLDNSSIITAGGAGIVLLRDNMGTTFNRLQFGGTTSAFPALKRNTDTLEVKLADDSAFATLSAGQVRANGLLAVSNGNATSNSDFLRLNPSDFAAGKPRLFIRKDSTAAQWTIGLNDSVNNAGSIVLDAAQLAITGALSVSGLAVARTVAITADGGISGDNATNSWAKIATITTPNNNGDISAVLMVSQGRKNLPSNAIISFHVRAQVISAGPPSLFISYLAKHGNVALADDSFKLVSTSNSVTELWVRKTATYCNFAIVELGSGTNRNTNDSIAYHDNASWQATAPTGLVEASTNGVEVGGALSAASLLSTGGVTGVNLLASGQLGFTNGSVLTSPGANVIEQYNGTSAQAFRVYNTRSNSSDYERFSIDWQTIVNACVIGTEKSSPGLSRTLGFMTDGVRRWYIDTSGNLRANTDATYDIGASSDNRPRNLYVATAGFLGKLVLGGNTTLESDATNTLALRNGTSSQAFRLYKTFTNSSNYERLAIRETGSNDFLLMVEHAGTGVARSLVFGTNNFGRWQIDTSGHLLAATADTYDIGYATTNRPRDIHLSRHLYSGGSVLAASNGFLAITSRLAITSSTNGVAMLSNSEQTDFSMLQFGGTTSSFPALKRSGVQLQVRSADDTIFGDIRANRYYMAFGSILRDNADGVVVLLNNAGTDFSTLQFGGATNAFPALKRNGAGLEVRTADGSVFTGIRASRLVLGQGSFVRDVSNGNIHLGNADDTNFGSLMLGGTTSAFPAIKRNGAAIDVRLADDSDFTDINAKNITLTGALNAISKSFVIQHPTKPDMTLQHGSLEGPEFGVYFRGELKDSFVIELPDYWEGLVDESTITVSLTPIGYPQGLFVEKVSDNKVHVGNPSYNRHPHCYYVVYAERKDVEKLQVEY